MPTPTRSLSQVTVCLLLLGVVGFAMSAQYAIGMPPLLKADEKQHAAYAIVLSQGVLPTIDTNTPADPVRYPQFAEALFGLDEPRRDIWVANHPPLFYVMSLPLVWLGDAVGDVGVTLLGMRLLNALGYALSIILIGLLARELVPRRRVVPVLAAATVLGCGAVTYDGGAIYNDGWGTVAASLTLLLGFRMVREGVTRDRLIWATVAGVAAASFRSTGLVAVLVLGGCVLAALWLRDPTLRTFRRGVLLAVRIGLAPVVVIGWFYVRNIVLYGDPTASAALFEKFSRQTHGDTLFQLVNPQLYLHLYGSLWADDVIPKVWALAAAATLVVTVTGLVLDVNAKARPRPGGVMRRAMSTAVLLTDVGFGVSQVLPVLVLLAYAEPGDTVILEQPEIHLHPAVQSGLADVIVETALARGVQVILESHSEHLLSRLQRRVAERMFGKGLILEPRDIALYFSDVDQDTSRIRELEVDLFGNIGNWPRDFFGNQTAEALAMLEARVERES